MNLEIAAAPSRLRGVLGLIGRHQVASAITTVVDFATMVFCVQILAAPAAIAAMAGASVGAVLNFQIGRRWTFAATSGPLGKQAARYAIVSATSAALNGAGELALHDGAGVQYIVARAFVAVVVSFAWNLPMQRHFVFGDGAKT